MIALTTEPQPHGVMSPLRVWLYLLLIRTNDCSSLTEEADRREDLVVCVAEISCGLNGVRGKTFEPTDPGQRFIIDPRHLDSIVLRGGTSRPNETLSSQLS